MILAAAWSLLTALWRALPRTESMRPARWYLWRTPNAQPRWPSLRGSTLGCISISLRPSRVLMSRGRYAAVTSDFVVFSVQTSTRSSSTIHFCEDAFREVFAAQFEEFTRLYGRVPSRLDGHQHMHLCTNMLVDGLYPAGARVRRNLSFTAVRRAS